MVRKGPLLPLPTQCGNRMNKTKASMNRYDNWHLYWVESDGIEDCFVAARNSRSACKIEIEMNGFDFNQVHATRVLRIPVNIARSYLREKTHKSWPWYVYGQRFFEKVGAEFRTAGGKQEMLLDDVVYEIDDYAPCGITKSRSIGEKAVRALTSEPFFRDIGYEDEDVWTGSAMPIISGLGMCLATCQLIEHYICNSFLLGISKKQKQKYGTIKDLSEGWKKKTLGNMIWSIEEAWEIHPVLKAGIELFLQNRNLLVHGITTSERYDIRTRWGQEELIAFLSFFDVNASLVKKAFRSSYYAGILFAVHKWGRPEKLSRRMFGRKHEKEADMFFSFFEMKEDAV